MGTVREKGSSGILWMDISRFLIRVKVIQESVLFLSLRVLQGKGGFGEAEV